MIETYEDESKVLQNFSNFGHNSANPDTFAEVIKKKNTGLQDTEIT